MFPPVLDRWHGRECIVYGELNSDEPRATGAKWNEKEAMSTCVETRSRRISPSQTSRVVDFHSLSSRLAWNDYAFPTDYPLRRENFSGFTSSCYIKIPEQTRAGRIAASGARHCPRVAALSRSFSRRGSFRARTRIRFPPFEQEFPY